jgi:hypothetical protein
MTIPTLALADLAEKGADVDVLRQMVQFMAQRLMELDVDGRCGAGYHEKTPERLTSRIGNRDRTWDTRAGSVELQIPKLRQGSCLPELLEPRRTGREGADGGHPGGLHPGRVDPIGGRVGQVPGHERRVQEPDQPAVRRTRRARRRLLEPPDRGRLALPVDRRHVREDTPGRAGTACPRTANDRSPRNFDFRKQLVKAGTPARSDQHFDLAKPFCAIHTACLSGGSLRAPMVRTIGLEARTGGQAMQAAVLDVLGDQRPLVATGLHRQGGDPQDVQRHTAGRSLASCRRESESVCIEHRPSACAGMDVLRTARCSSRRRDTRSGTARLLARRTCRADFARWQLVVRHRWLHA